MVTVEDLIVYGIIAVMMLAAILLFAGVVFGSMYIIYKLVAGMFPPDVQHQHKLHGRRKAK